MNHKNAQKISSILLSVVYFHVNVAWAASPSLPLPSYTFSWFQNIKAAFKTNPEDDVIVFHGTNDWMYQQPKQLEQPANADLNVIQKEKDLPSSNSTATDIGQSRQSVEEIKNNPVREAAKDVLGTTHNLENLNFGSGQNTEEISQFKAALGTLGKAPTIMEHANGVTEIMVNTPALKATLTLTPDSNGRVTASLSNIDAKQTARTNPVTPTQPAVQKTEDQKSNSGETRSNVKEVAKAANTKTENLQNKELVRLDPTEVGPVIAFGVQIPVSNMQSAIVDKGQMVINLKQPVHLAQDVQVADGTTLHGSELTQIRIDIVSGQATGIAASHLTQPITISAPENLGKPGESSGNAIPTPVQAATRNVSVEKTAGGVTLTPIGMNAFVQVTLSNPTQANGPLKGQVNIASDHADLRVVGQGATLLGRDFSAGWRINVGQQGNFVLTGSVGNSFKNLSTNATTVVEKSNNSNQPVILVFKNNYLQAAEFAKFNNSAVVNVNETGGPEVGYASKNTRLSSDQVQETYKGLGGGNASHIVNTPIVSDNLHKTFTLDTKNATTQTYDDNSFVFLSAPSKTTPGAIEVRAFGAEKNFQVAGVKYKVENNQLKADFDTLKAKAGSEAQLTPVMMPNGALNLAQVTNIIDKGDGNASVELKSPFVSAMHPERTKDQANVFVIGQRLEFGPNVTTSKPESSGVSSIVLVKGDGRNIEKGFINQGTQAFSFEKSDVSPFEFDGNSVSGSNGRAQTILSASNIGKEVTTIDAKGISTGVVTAMPQGVSLVKSGQEEGETLTVTFNNPDKSQLALKVVEGANTSYRLTADYQGSNTFKVEAGSSFKVEGQGISLMSGSSLRADGGKDFIPAGQTGFNIVLAGHGPGVAVKPDVVAFEKGKGVTFGRMFVEKTQDGSVQIGVRPGTVLLDSAQVQPEIAAGGNFDFTQPKFINNPEIARMASLKNELGGSEAQLQPIIFSNQSAGTVGADLAKNITGKTCSLVNGAGQSIQFTVMNAATLKTMGSVSFTARDEMRGVSAGVGGVTQAPTGKFIYGTGQFTGLRTKVGGNDAGNKSDSEKFTAPTVQFDASGKVTNSAHALINVSKSNQTTTLKDGTVVTKVQEITTTETPSGAEGTPTKVVATQSSNIANKGTKDEKVLSSNFNSKTFDGQGQLVSDQTHDQIYKGTPQNPNATYETLTSRDADSEGNLQTTVTTIRGQTKTVQTADGHEFKFTNGGKNLDGSTKWINKEDTSYNPEVGMRFGGTSDKYSVSLGFSIKESNLGVYTGAVNAVGAVALAIPTGGASLAWGLVAAASGFAGGMQASSQMEHGGSWGGAIAVIALSLAPSGFGGAIKGLTAAEGWAAMSGGARAWAIGTKLVGQLSNAASIGYAVGTQVTYAESPTNTNLKDTTVATLSAALPFIGAGLSALKNVGRVANLLEKYEKLEQNSPLLLATVKALGGGVIGAGAGYLDHRLNDSGGASGAQKIIGGFVAGTLGVAFYGLVNKLASGTKLAGLATKVGGVTGEVGSFWKAGKGSYLLGGLGIVRNLASGTVATTAYRALTGRDVLSADTIKQGAYVGFFGFGALQAVSNWPKAATSLVAVPSAKGQTFLQAIKSADYAAFGVERLKNAVMMGVWESVVNNVKFDPSKTGQGFFNPLTWANGLGQLVDAALVKVGAVSKEELANRNQNDPLDKGTFSSRASQKFSETFQSIFIMHPFFQFGRPGKNIATDLVSAGTQRLLSGAESKLIAGNTIRSAGLFTLSEGAKNMVVMPVTIKTFELFETQGVSLAVKANLLQNVTADGKGGFVPTMQGDEKAAFGIEFFKTLGFVNAPIAPTVSAESKALQSKLQGNFLGRLVSVDARNEQRALAASVARSQNSISFDMHGQTYEIHGRDDVNSAKNLASSVLLNGNPEIAKKMANGEIKAGDVIAIAENRSVRLVELTPNQSPDSFLKTDRGTHELLLSESPDGSTHVVLVIEKDGTLAKETRVQTSDIGIAGEKLSGRVIEHENLSTGAKTQIVELSASELAKVGETGQKLTGADAAKSYRFDVTGEAGQETMSRETAPTAEAGKSVDRSALIKVLETETPAGSERTIGIDSNNNVFVETKTPSSYKVEETLPDGTKTSFNVPAHIVETVDSAGHVTQQIEINGSRNILLGIAGKVGLVDVSNPNEAAAFQQTSLRIDMPKDQASQAPISATAKVTALESLLSPKAKATSDQLAAARATLGLEASDVLLPISGDFQKQAQIFFISSLSKNNESDVAQLTQLVSAASSEKTDSLVGYMAMNKLHGEEAARVWDGLRNAGADTSVLVDMGINGLDNIASVKNERGEIEISLASIAFKDNSAFKAEQSRNLGEHESQVLIVSPVRGITLENRTEQTGLTRANGEVVELSGQALTMTHVETVDVEGNRRDSLRADVKDVLPNDKQEAMKTLLEIAGITDPTEVSTILSQQRQNADNFELNFKIEGTKESSPENLVGHLELTSIESVKNGAVVDHMTVINSLREARAQSAELKQQESQLKQAEASAPVPAKAGFFQPVIDYFTVPLAPSEYLGGTSFFPINTYAKIAATAIGVPVSKIMNRFGSDRSDVSTAKINPSDSAATVLSKDGRYITAAIRAVDLKISLIEQGRWNGEGPTSFADQRVYKAAVEGVQSNHYRALSGLVKAREELAKEKTSEAPDATGASPTVKPVESMFTFEDGASIKNVKELETKLIADFKRLGNTAEGLKALIDATRIQDASKGLTQLDNAKIQSLRDGIRAISDPVQKAAFKGFVEAVENHVKAPSEDSLTVVAGKLESIFNAFDLNIYSKNISEKKITALDTLLGEHPANEKIEAYKDLFNGSSAKNFNDLNTGERFVLSLALAQRHFETYNDNGFKEAPKVQDRSFGFGLMKSQAALLMQFSLGRMAGLAAGGGKTAMFIAGFGDYFAKNTNKKGVGELIVYSPDEAAKYLKRYQPLARAMGFEFVNGIGLEKVQEGDSRIRGTYDPNSTKEGKDGEPALRKVVVLDFHSRGFLENNVRARPNSEMAALLKNVIVQGMDEADALLLSQMSFISSDGNAVAKTDAVNHVRSIMNGVLEVTTDQKGTDFSFKPNVYRNFKAGEIPDAALRQGEWFTVTRSGSVEISDGLMSKLKEKTGAEGTEIRQVLRALDAVQDKTKLIFDADINSGDPALRPVLISNGNPQYGQIDSSLVFNVAAVLIHNKLMDGKKDVNGETMKPLSETDIRLSEAGSMATFVQVLQREVDHRFGATGTPENMMGLSELSIRMRVVNVEPSLISNYNVTEGVPATDRIQSGEKKKKEVSLIAASNVTDAVRAGEATKAVNRSLGDKQFNNGRGAGIIVAMNESANKMLVMNLLRENTALGSDHPFMKELQGLAQRSDVSLRDFIKKLKTNAPDVANVKDLADRFQVIDGRFRNEVEGIVAQASQGSIVLANDSGLRALDYVSKPNGAERKTMVDLFMSGHENFTMEGWLQALARVDRGQSVGARRTVLLDTNILDKHLAEASSIQNQLKVDGKSDGLFGQEAKLVHLTTLLERHQKGETLNLKDKMELAAQFLSKDNRARSALFFIGEQTSVQLLKQPVQDMIAREKIAGNAAGVEFLENLYQETLSHSDKGDFTSNTGLQDFKAIAAKSFNGAAMVAVQFLARIAIQGKGKVSDSISLEAVMRVSDIRSAMENVDVAFRDAAKTDLGDVKTSFSQVSESIFGNASPANMVLNVVAELGSRYLISNTALGKATAVNTEVVSVEAFSKAAESRAGPEAAALIADVSARLRINPAFNFKGINSSGSPSTMLTQQGQILARSALAILSLSPAQQQNLDLAVLGFNPQSNTVAAQASFLGSNFFNPEAAIALAQDVSALSSGQARFTVAESAAILNNSNPEEALARTLLSHDSVQDAGTKKILQDYVRIVDQRAQREVASQYFDSKIVDGQPKPTFAAYAKNIGAALGEQLPSIPVIGRFFDARTVAQLQKTELSNLAPDAKNNPAALTAMAAILARPEGSGSKSISSADRKNIETNIQKLASIDKSADGKTKTSNLLEKTTVKDVVTSVGLNKDDKTTIMNRFQPLVALRNLIKQKELGAAFESFSPTTRKVFGGVSTALALAGSLALGGKLIVVGMPVIVAALGLSLAFKIAAGEPQKAEPNGLMKKFGGVANLISGKNDKPWASVGISGALLGTAMYFNWVGMVATLAVGFVTVTINAVGGTIGKKYGAYSDANDMGLKAKVFLSKFIPGLSVSNPLHAVMTLETVSRNVKTEKDAALKTSGVEGNRSKVVELRQKRSQVDSKSAEAKSLETQISSLEDQISTGEQEVNEDIPGEVFSRVVTTVNQNSSIESNDKPEVLRQTLVLSGFEDARAAEMVSVVAEHEQNQSALVEALNKPSIPSATRDTVIQIFNSAAPIREKLTQVKNVLSLPAQSKVQAAVLKVFNNDRLIVLGGLELSKLKDEKVKLSFFNVVNQFEASLPLGTPVTLSAIRATTISGADKAALIKHYVGEIVTEADLVAIGKVTDNLVAFKAKVGDTPAATGNPNLIKTVFQSIQNGKVDALFVDVLKSNSHPIAAVAEAVAQVKAKTIAEVETALKTAGVKSADINNLKSLLALPDNRSMNKTVTQAINSLRTEGNVAVAPAILDSVKEKIASTFNMDTVVGLKAFTSDGVPMAQKNVDLLLTVANAGVTRTFGSWSADAAMYQTVAMLSGTAQVSIKQYSSGNRWDVYQEQNGSPVLIAQLFRSTQNGAITVKMQNGVKPLDLKNVSETNTISIQTEKKEGLKVVSSVAVQPAFGQLLQIRENEFWTAQKALPGGAPVVVSGREKVTAFRFVSSGATSSVTPKDFSLSNTMRLGDKLNAVNESEATATSSKALPAVAVPQAVSNAKPVAAKPAVQSPAAQVAPSENFSLRKGNPLLRAAAAIAIVGSILTLGVTKSVAGEAAPTAFHSIGHQVTNTLIAANPHWAPAVVFAATVIGIAVTAFVSMGVMKPNTSSAPTFVRQSNSTQGEPVGSVIMSNAKTKTSEAFVAHADLESDVAARSENKQEQIAIISAAPANDIQVLGEKRTWLTSLTLSTPFQFPSMMIKSLVKALYTINQTEPTRDQAAQQIGTLLDGSLGSIARTINVAPLLQLESAQAEVKTFLNNQDVKVLLSGANLTLSDVENSKAPQEFKAFVYELVAKNSQTVVFKDQAYVSTNLIRDQAALFGTPVTLVHTHENINLSVADMSAFAQLKRIFGATFNAPLLVAAQGKLMAFTDMNAVLFKGSENNSNETAPQPTFVPYQNSALVLTENESVMGSLMSLLVSLRPQSGATLAANPFTGSNGRALAEAALKLFGSLAQVPGLTSNDVRTAFAVAGILSQNGGNFTPAIDQELSSNVRLRGLDLNQVLLGLARELKRSDVTPGLAPTIGTLSINAYHQFNNVAAVINQQHPSVDMLMQNGAALSLMNRAQAAAEVKRLKREVASSHLGHTLAQLKALAGNNLNQARVAAQQYVTPGQMDDLFAGKSNNVAAELPVALQLLLQPLINQVSRQTGLPFEKGIRSVEISVAYESALVQSGKTPQHGGIALDEATGVAQIVIGIKDGSSPTDALIQAVGILAHEISHPFAGNILRSQSLGLLGIPRTLDEAVTQNMASQALRELGLNDIANVIDLDVAKHVVELADTKVNFVPYKTVISDSKNKNAWLLKLKNSVSDTNAKERIQVIAETAAEFADAAKNGIPAILLNQLSELKPLDGETPLQAYARLYLGITNDNVRLMMTKEMLLGADVSTLWKMIVTLGNNSEPVLSLLLQTNDFGQEFTTLLNSIETARKTSTHA